LILQPNLINNLEAQFGDEVKSKRVYNTPGTPRFKIVHNFNAIFPLLLLTSIEEA
jgi:hypothetical protein